MKLVVSLATRGRPELLLKTLSKIVRNISLADTALFVMADADDDPTIEAVTRAQFDDVSCSVKDREDTVGGKWNRALAETADVYCVMVDHSYFSTKGFDREIIEAAKLFHDGIGVIYNHLANASFPGTQSVTAGWIKLTGEIYPEYFPYWFVDHWLDDIARIVNRIAFCDAPYVAWPKPMTQEMREPDWWATWFDTGYLRRREIAHKIISAMDEPQCNKERFYRHHPLIEYRSKWVNSCVVANAPIYEASKLQWDDRYKRIRQRAVDLIPWLLNGMPEQEARQFTQLLTPRVQTFGRTA